MPWWAVSTGSAATLRYALKHDTHALDVLIGEAARLSQRHSLSQKVRDGAIGAWTYFTNHRHQMD